MSAKSSSNGQSKEPPDLDNVVDKMRLDYLQCRDFGHSWRPYTAHYVPQYGGYYESVLRCQRCRSMRTREIGHGGQNMSSHYEYSEGYLIAGIGRLTGTDRDKIRLASVLRVLAPDTAED